MDNQLETGPVTVHSDSVRAENVRKGLVTMWDETCKMAPSLGRTKFEGMLIRDGLRVVGGRIKTILGEADETTLLAAAETLLAKIDYAAPILRRYVAGQLSESEMTGAVRQLMAGDEDGD